MPKQTDIMKPLGYPRRGKDEPQMTAMQLFKSTWPTQVEGMKRIAVVGVKTGTVKKSAALGKNIPFYRVRTFNKDKQHPHDVTIFLPEGQPFTSRSHVIVDCTCPAHTYWFEYVLAKKYGNALIWRCNGDPPNERNPRKVLGICKHTAIALRHLMRKAKDGTLVRKSREPIKLSLKRGK